METARKFGTMIILILIQIKILKVESFQISNKSLNIIHEQTLNLSCIRVDDILNTDEIVFRLLLNTKIPMWISSKSSSESQLQTTLCPNIFVQLHSIETLGTVLANFVTYTGTMLILLSQKIDWQNINQYSEYYWNLKRIYKVFYISGEHLKFYHPFIIENDKYGAMVDARDHNIRNIFKNLHGYPMRVYVFDAVFSEVNAKQDAFNVTSVKGVDAKAAYLLEKIFNFTMQLQWPDDNFFGARLENGSFNGALGRLIRYETDIVMTGFFIKDYLTRDFHFSVPVYMDKLCCYVIKSKRIPKSFLPLYAVKENLWLAYISVGIFSSFVWMLLRRVNVCIDRYSRKQMTSRRTHFSSLRLQYFSIFTDTWVLWARMSIVRFPPYNSERMFAISLCLVSVIIGAILESSLATVYIKPHYYKDINTLEELEKANLKILIKHAAMRDDLFRDQNSSLHNILDQRVMLVGEPEERLISTMSKRGGFVAVTRESSFLIADIYYFITKKVHIIPECPKTYHIAYLFTKNSPYEEYFNEAFLQFLAAGLIEQWIDQTRHQAQCQIHNFEDYIAESSYQWKAFQISDLQLAFYVLILGNICAGLLFFAEYIMSST